MDLVDTGKKLRQPIQKRSLPGSLMENGFIAKVCQSALFRRASHEITSAFSLTEMSANWAALPALFLHQLADGGIHSLQLSFLTALEMRWLSARGAKALPALGAVHLGCSVHLQLGLCKHDLPTQKLRIS